MKQEVETCDELHPLFCEDPDGERPLRCGLPKGHEGEHQDSRELPAEQGERAEAH
jgi:hypothetical protein